MKTWRKQWSMLSEFEIPELPWQAVEKVIKRPRELDMLACIHYVGPEDQSEDYVPQENLKDTPFTKTLRNTVVRGALMSLRYSVVAFLCRLGLIVEEAVTRSSQFIAVVVTGVGNSRDQVVACNFPAEAPYKMKKSHRGSSSSRTQIMRKLPEEVVQTPPYLPWLHPCSSFSLYLILCWVAPHDQEEKT